LVGTISVHISVVAFLSTVNDSITAERQATVGTALVWSGVGVPPAVIANFAEAWVDDVVSVSAVVIATEVEPELIEEGVAGALVEEDGDHCVGRTVGGGVVELSLEIGVMAVDCVLAGGVEPDESQHIQPGVTGNAKHVVDVVVDQGNSSAAVHGGDAVGLGIREGQVEFTTSEEG